MSSKDDFYQNFQTKFQATCLIFNAAKIMSFFIGQKKIEKKGVFDCVDFQFGLSPPTSLCRDFSMVIRYFFFIPNL
jgi:hypothetical protein